LLESVEQRHQELRNPGGVERLAAVQKTPEAFAFLMLHHHIGRAVGLEIAQHGYDVGMPEVNQRARFLLEAIEAPDIFLFVGVADRMHRAVAVAHGDAVGHELLDRDLALDGNLDRFVGDAEAARAQDRRHAIAVEFGADIQSVPLGCGHDFSFARRP